MKWSEENKRLRELLREAETYIEYVISGVYTPAGGKITFNAT